MVVVLVVGGEIKTAGKGGRGAADEGGRRLAENVSVARPRIFSHAKIKKK